MAKRKKDGRVNNGRPSKGLSEVSVEVRMPRSMLEAIDAASGREGVTRSAWLRETIRKEVLLGVMD